MAGFVEYDEGGSTLTRERRRVLSETVSLIRRAYKEAREWDCYVLFSSITELEEILWLSLNIGPKCRAAIKRFEEAERKARNVDIDNLSNS